MSLLSKLLLVSLKRSQTQAKTNCFWFYLYIQIEFWIICSFGEYKFTIYPYFFFKYLANPNCKINMSLRVDKLLNVCYKINFIQSHNNSGFVLYSLHSSDHYLINSSTFLFLIFLYCIIVSYYLCVD